MNKPATVNRIMCRLGHMLNKAVEWQLLDASLMRRLKFLLDFDSGMLVTRDSKNGESRHVPMDSTVAELFRDYPLTSGSDFVFTNATETLSGIQWQVGSETIRLL